MKQLAKEVIRIGFDMLFSKLYKCMAIKLFSYA